MYVLIDLLPLNNLYYHQEVDQQYGFRMFRSFLKCNSIRLCSHEGYVLSYQELHLPSQDLNWLHTHNLDLITSRPNNVRFKMDRLDFEN